MWKSSDLGVTVTNTSVIREDIKRRINMGNAWYYSLKKILSSHLLSKKLKVKTYKTTSWQPVLRYGESVFTKASQGTEFFVVLALLCKFWSTSKLCIYIYMPNLTETFIGTDTASVELFYNIFTSGIETFIIPWD